MFGSWSLAVLLPCDKRTSSGGRWADLRDAKLQPYRVLLTFLSSTQQADLVRRPPTGLPDLPAQPVRDTRPLSIGLVSPAWPLDFMPNGIIPYVSALAEGLETLGHRVTILTTRAAPGSQDPRVVQAGSLERAVGLHDRGGKVVSVHYEASVCVATLEGGTRIKNLYKPFDGHTDCTAEEVNQARQRFQEARRIADETRSALYSFGESDALDWEVGPAIPPGGTAGSE